MAAAGAREGNLVLASLGSAIGALRPHIKPVQMRAGEVLCDFGQTIGTVYFPAGGMVSKIAVCSDGREVESALIGRCGAVGTPAVMGLRVSITRDLCLAEGSAWSIAADQLLAVMDREPQIAAALLRCSAWELNCAVRNGACNTLHTVQQRLARWLLTSSDVLGASQIRLSQEAFARALGVQRTSVNPALQALQAEGLITVGRSRVGILDRDRLMARGCECYDVTRHAYGGFIALPAA